MFMVGAELIEVDGKDVTGNGVIVLEVVSEPQLEAVLLASSEARSVVGKDVGINAHQTTAHATFVVHARVEDLIDTLVLVLLQPDDKPVDEGIEDVANVSVHVGEVVGDKVKQRQNLRDVFIIFCKLGPQTNSDGTCSVASVDPVSQEDSNALVSSGFVADGCQAKILIDVTVVLIQGSQQAFAHYGSQMVTLDQSDCLAPGQQGDRNCAEASV